MKDAIPLLPEVAQANIQLVMFPGPLDENDDMDSNELYDEDVVAQAKEAQKLHEIHVVQQDVEKEFVHQFLQDGKYSHLIAIERLGSNKEGIMCNMRGDDVSPYNGRIDEVFTIAKGMEGVTTIGIGDGGNEIGMGSALEIVKEVIPGGENIGTVVEVDHLLCVGVSNWAGVREREERVCDE
eukprot:TRINITY_DN311_c1_g1_i2.p1 TRINITY_DN311_c1_g1~~TRINITY_DN311_c1_g1_i2.p1  ORF type:complete len:182 (-),score=62.38 TRINITY_DN311_c1_g1_i2:26-571(-)